MRITLAAIEDITCSTQSLSLVPENSNSSLRTYQVREVRHLND